MTTDTLPDTLMGLKFDAPAPATLDRAQLRRMIAIYADRERAHRANARECERAIALRSGRGRHASTYDATDRAQARQHDGAANRYARLREDCELRLAELATAEAA